MPEYYFPQFCLGSTSTTSVGWKSTEKLKSTVRRNPTLSTLTCAISFQKRTSFYFDTWKLNQTITRTWSIFQIKVFFVKVNGFMLVILGVERLQKSFTTVIRFHLKTIGTLRTRNVTQSDLISSRRKLNPRNQSKTHFKRTNYRPAMRNQGESMVRLDEDDDFFAPSRPSPPPVEYRPPPETTNNCMPSRKRPMNTGYTAACTAHNVDKSGYRPVEQATSSYTPVFNTAKRVKSEVSEYTPCL